ncbi:hypothetical protein LOOC260_121200 [Paucilactobacillus hokkaidonensis JCM 18461]|uniref:DUF1002 domain-containing protein n=2 Tax=Paucilactobacillus hokkaidonensis TaxID=1193095 RepID=A0A0A1H1Q2_9LACO|nr:DUF1002 domain-containing protein [Paucilactobacillus hokkaidonensis]KRO08763.1 hypothetical protein IV59_GL001169 [Paucilactobacillus hokkaidonensis]BAP86626.1 hypothetical protein LOOC260_121200 [Paucilactobacillus hokkaidonensis JCM 18461]
MKFIKKIALTLALVLVGAIAIPAVTQLQTNTVAHAETTADTSSSSAVQTKALSKPYVVYGAGLASSDRSSVASALGANDNYTSLTSTATDYSKYISSDGTTDSAMISSVALAPADSGTGVKVNIVKYNGDSNITSVTAQQYAMVATMAGVNDLIITVTANKAVSGEAALTGVYKALAADGITLSSENTSAANGILEATQPAIDQNSDDKTYSGKLMAAVGTVSADLAKQRQDDNEYATKAEVRQMLDEALEKNNVSSKTPDSSKVLIVNALIQVQKAPVSTSKTYISNAKNVASSLKNSAGNAMAKLGDFANSADGKALMAKYGNLFQRVWQQIVEFFQGIF